MATKFQRQVKAAVGADKTVCKSDGSVELMDSFYYRMDRSAEKWAARVSEKLQAAGLKVEVVSSREDWAQWPKTSYFVAVVRELTEGA